MWVAKILFVTDETAIFASLTKKHNVTLLGYPLNYFKKRGKNYYVGAGVVLGEEKNKNAFYKKLLKDKRVSNFERRGDYMIGVFEQLERLKTLYNPELIRVSPVILNNKGEEIWEMGSLKKEPLMKFISNAKKAYGEFKLISFRQEKAVNLSVLNIVPELTEKQKRALQLAVENGYYDYPRRIELEKLAKLMKLSYSTYQAHLRKAEQRLMPFFSKKM